MSSTTFSPALFLSQMHATADTQSLLLGLDTLSQSIDQKSASLKVLVESNFERFVRAKSVIDNVYKEMKYRGVDPVGPPRARAHSRHASRNSFRNSSVSGAQPLSPPLANDPRKRNALIKESEYGVMGIKAPLLDVSAKAEDVWGPALGGREKEEVLRTVSSSIEQFREYVELSAAIAESIKRKDHDTLVEEYVKARRFADEAKLLAQQVGNAQADESRLYKVLIAARMWHDVDEQIQAFKRDVWRRLISIHTLSNVDTGSGLPQDQHMELISLLLELGVEDNPVWVWLLSRYDYLKGKVQATAERLKMEIEILRRRLANADKPAPQLMATHLKAVGRPSMASKTPAFDQADIVELWEKMVSFLTGLLSSQGIVGEVLDFWRTVDGFVDGRLQKSLPNGYNGESLKHHGLSPQGITELQKGVVELVNMIREHAMEFFAGPPPDDISALLSPTVLTPRTPLSSLSEALSPTMAGDPRFDANNLPPVSPRRGEAWEKFAFWPPWSNSISGVHYLSRMLALVGSGASDMASMTPVARGDPAEVERLKTLVGASRERCVTALSAAWNRDAENIKFVEDWHRSSDHKDVTKMPVSFATFEGTLLSGMQKILYISDATTQPGAEDIVLSPPTKLLQMVRSQYVTTLYKALSGMVENAERSVKKADDDWTTDVEGFTAPGGALNGRVSTMGGGTINAGDRVRPDTTARPRDGESMANMPSERSHAPYTQQPPVSALRGRPRSQHPVRERLLRQTHRRKQDDPRRPRPDRRAPLPVLHAAVDRHSPQDDPRRRDGARLGAPAGRAPARGQALCVRGAARARARAHAGVDDGRQPDKPGALVPAGADVARAVRGLPRARALRPRGAHAGHARRRVRRPDAQPVHDGPRVGAAAADLPGARRPHRQRRPRPPADGAARDAERAQAPARGCQERVRLLPQAEARGRRRWRQQRRCRRGHHPEGHGSERGQRRAEGVKKGRVLLALFLKSCGSKRRRLGVFPHTGDGRSLGRGVSGFPPAGFPSSHRKKVPCCLKCS